MNINRKIIELNSDFVKAHPDNYEQYAILDTHAFAKIFGNLEKIPMGEQEGLLKISCNCRSIYRKYRGMSIEGEQNYVAISYKARKHLKASLGDEVQIKRACWFCYLWNYYDVTIRGAFRIAIIGIVISIILSLVSIVF